MDHEIYIPPSCKWKWFYAPHEWRRIRRGRVGCQCIAPLATPSPSLTQFDLEFTIETFCTLKPMIEKKQPTPHDELVEITRLTHAHQLEVEREKTRRSQGWSSAIGGSRVTDWISGIATPISVTIIAMILCATFYFCVREFSRRPVAPQKVEAKK